MALGTIAGRPWGGGAGRRQSCELAVTAGLGGSRAGSMSSLRFDFIIRFGAKVTGQREWGQREGREEGGLPCPAPRRLCALLTIPLCPGNGTAQGDVIMVPFLDHSARMLKGVCGGKVMTIATALFRATPPLAPGSPASLPRRPR